MSNLVGKQAPHIQSKAVHNKQILSDFSLSQYKGKNIILFFYPLDFTFVCPTELIAFQTHLKDFEARNCQVVGCSVDSAYTHLAWLSTPQSKGGIEGITYPLIADLNKACAKSYNVLTEDGEVALRGLFFIDAKGIVRHQVVNDLPLGRSIPETLRTIDAWLQFEKHGEVCPANWQVGKIAMKPTQQGLEEYFAKVRS